MITRLVEVRTQPGRSSKKISVFAALDELRRLWLDVDSVEWLIQYVQAEKANGGVMPVEEDPEDSSTVAEADQCARIYWNFRDDNWIARAKGVDGTWLQTSRGIKRRQKAESLGFEAAKQAVYEEMEQWVADVQAGQITKSDD